MTSTERTVSGSKVREQWLNDKRITLEATMWDVICDDALELANEMGCEVRFEGVQVDPNNPDDIILRYTFISKPAPWWVEPLTTLGVAVASVTAVYLVIDTLSS